jgi:hypothetical protein
VIERTDVLFFIFWIGLRDLSDLGVKDSEAVAENDAAAVLLTVDLGVLNAITRD